MNDVRSPVRDVLGIDGTVLATAIRAVAWLLGQLDAEVPVPLSFVCDQLGIDPAALAAAVRCGTHC